MISLSLTEARARLPELLDRVAAGEEVHITRHGTDVAVLVEHDRWMKTKRQDLLAGAREIRRRMEEVPDAPWSDFTPVVGWDVEAHVAELREGRDDDPRDDRQRDHPR